MLRMDRAAASWPATDIAWPQPHTARNTRAACCASVSSAASEGRRTSTNSGGKAAAKRTNGRPKRRQMSTAGPEGGDAAGKPHPEGGSSKAKGQRCAVAARGCAAPSGAATGAGATTASERSESSTEARMRASPRHPAHANTAVSAAAPHTRSSSGSNFVPTTAGSTEASCDSEATTKRIGGVGMTACERHDRSEECSQRRFRASQPLSRHAPAPPQTPPPRSLRRRTAPRRPRTRRPRTLATECPTRRRMRWPRTPASARANSCRQ